MNDADPAVYYYHEVTLLDTIISKQDQYEVAKARADITVTFSQEADALELYVSGIKRGSTASMSPDPRTGIPPID